ncbi:DUF5350 domain-containing protein [Methanogenium organophilum]|uniref:DUF5350 domain-containing protein n=1 Tax=Methanogenium organophilum TaxID=2199 RepID=A0A9X9S5D4_METOG|nr:DUF5350 domain-containing protein [Methanogenium organophilum]WAI01836.1 DUF5350 domain-containing protein [Methanogenium organophilum]
MGKTGTTTWTQIKSVKGQVRLVPAKEGTYKKPGPNQRFKTGNQLKKALKASQDDGRRGGRGGRGGARGRGRGPENDPRFRRRIRRSPASIKGSK